MGDWTPKVNEQVRVIKDDLSWYGAEGFVTHYDGGMNRYHVQFQGVGGHFRADELEPVLEPPQPTAALLDTLRGALERIAEMSGEDEHGVFDEWSQTEAFHECQRIAQAALDAAEKGDAK